MGFDEWDWNLPSREKGLRGTICSCSGDDSEQRHRQDGQQPHPSLLSLQVCGGGPLSLGACDATPPPLPHPPPSPSRLDRTYIELQ